MQVLGIVGSVSTASKTRAAVEEALDAATAATDRDVETELLHLAEYDIEDASGTPLEEMTGDTAAALDLILESDAYVVGTPVYRAGFSGVLKNLLDTVPRGIWQAEEAPLENAAVGLVATGAAEEHYLAIDDELRPLLAFFGAHAVGSSVYATDEAFEDGAVADDETAERLATLGGAVVELQDAIENSEHLADFPPQI